MLTAQRTIDAWLETRREGDGRGAPDIGSVACMAAPRSPACCRELLDEAARACGSHPFATGGDLDRARRDLELFLLQHRLDPVLARAGAVRWTARRKAAMRTRWLT